MSRYLIKTIALLGMMGFPATVLAQTANSVYIDQVGSNSTITMTQTGSNNILGTQNANTILHGNSQVITISQVGANNTGNFNIQGNSSNVTSNISGNLNTVTVNCGTAPSSSCADTLIEANATGNNNTLNVTAGSKSVAKINIDGDTNSATINSSTSNLLGAKSQIDITGGNSNIVNVSQSGPAGANGFDAKIDIVGGSNTVGVTQNGTIDSTVNIKTVGSSNTITVTTGN